MNINRTMNHLFVDYETAKDLKDVGFNDPCFALVDEANNIHLINISDEDSLLHSQVVSKYNNRPCVPSPTHQQVVDFLRKEYNIVIYVFESGLPYIGKYIARIQHKLNTDACNTYYEALNTAIKKAIKLIKKT